MDLTHEKILPSFSTTLPVTNSATAAGINVMANITEPASAMITVTGYMVMVTKSGLKLTSSQNLRGH